MITFGVVSVVAETEKLTFGLLSVSAESDLGFWASTRSQTVTLFAVFELQHSFV